MFEARKPKGVSIISEIAGNVKVNDAKNRREVIITNDEDGESITYAIPYGATIKLRSGDYVEKGG